MIFAGALWAVLPAIARGPLRLNAGGYGLLLAALGVGAVLGTVVVAWLRQRLGGGFVVNLFSVVYAASMLTVGLSHQTAVCVVVLVAGGMAWVAVQSTFSASAQVLLPGWARARGLAYFQLVVMGGQAFGALGWGALAEMTSPSWATVLPAIGLLVAIPVGGRLFALPDRQLDLAPARYWPEPAGLVEPDYTAGPVLVTVDWPVRPGKAAEFVEAMRAVGRSRRRTGATMWGLFQDIGAPTIFVETFVVATWHEHLRQHVERGTAMDQRLEADVRRFLLPGAVPRIRHLIWAAEAVPSRPEPARRGSPRAG
jgi:MFS family permease